MSERRRVIRVFAELGNPWPLWGSGAGEDPTPSPSDLGLSEELTHRMARWYGFWELHHHWERGWDSEANEDFSWVSGEEFIRQLRLEVSAFADVVDERYRSP